MKPNFSLKTAGFFGAMKKMEADATSAAETGMNDVIDETIRISSEIAPFEYGTLQRSHKKKVNVSRNGIDAEISYSVLEGGFNYAVWIHEGVYQLGAGSRTKGGTTSMYSGRSYQVGNKFLARPIKGEDQAFKDHIAKMVKGKLR